MSCQYNIIKSFRNIENRLLAVMLVQDIVHHLDFVYKLLFRIGIDAFAVIFQINHWRQGIWFIGYGVNKILGLNVAIAAEAVEMIGTDQKAAFTCFQPIFLK